MTRPEPVARELLVAWRMFDGMEDKYPVVIDNGRRMEWDSVMWVDRGPATAEDLVAYPTIKD